ncbi:aminoglycoside phosphotransferase family protein [Gryllotalpicola ginsengisoli]|uniref:aminoglycoside phosphotransferase family protein n=1 Tax=Gryllotalpicola ginsengisoli TaxID=444608 RepID=UPI0003B6F39E|nr:aminoglycoside phosphotransferase family protein [Gryllotalpicola ginsengisoli]
MDIPRADLVVTAELAGRLVAEQFPELAGPVRLVAQGWDNALFRLGDALSIRMPRREAAAHLIEHEQRFLPELQRLVGLPLPVPVAAGRPAEGYAFAWSVVPWVDGISGAHATPAKRDAYAPKLAEFFAAVHVPAAPDAPHNPVRGVPLTTRTKAVEQRLTGLAGRLAPGEAEELRALWRAGVEASVYAGAPVWLHGDPHPGNVVLADDGTRLAAVIDFGDLTAGDPATDLSAAWLHFGPEGRRAFRSRYAELRTVDEDTWARARAWAVSIGSAALAASDGSGAMATMGRAALDQLLDG